MINDTPFRVPTRSQQPRTRSARRLPSQCRGAFTGGGSSTQVVDDHQDHFEVQNYTSLALAKHFIRFGGRLRTTRDANYSNSQSLGIFTYSSLQEASGKPDSNGVISAYDIGVPSQYVVAQINQGSVHATLADLGIYAEDDWKPKPNFTVSYGLRFERRRTTFRTTPMSLRASPSLTACIRRRAHRRPCCEADSASSMTASR